MTNDRDFELFYREMHPRLWAYMVRTTREPDLADEIAQESFVRLLASRGAGLPYEARRAYLFRIAENLIRDAARRRARERTVSLDVDPEIVGPELRDPMSRRTAAALGMLSERERKLLWLAHVEGWKHADIARLLGLAMGSVRVLLHRARLRLQHRLKQEDTP